MEYQRFSDFAEAEGPLEGIKKSINEILNLEILVLSFKIGKSSYPEKSEFYVTIQFELNNKKYVIFTGSKVLREQLDKYRDKLPFLTKIVKVDKYYTFS